MTRFIAILAVVAVAGCSQSLDTGSRLGALVDKVTTVAPAIVEIVNALGIDPIDMNAEDAEAIHGECLKVAEIGAPASDLEQRVCDLAKQIVGRAPVDPTAELSPIPVKKPTE